MGVPLSPDRSAGRTLCVPVDYASRERNYLQTALGILFFEMFELERLVAMAHLTAEDR